MARRRISRQQPAAAALALLGLVAAGCGGSTKTVTVTTPVPAANSARPTKHAQALPKRPNGKVGSYDVWMTIDWRTNRGTATFKLLDSHCATAVFKGTTPASGKQPTFAFIAQQNGSCFVEPSKASWDVHTDSGSRIVSVIQVGPGLYLAGCGSGLAFDCQSGPPLGWPELRIT